MPPLTTTGARRTYVRSIRAVLNMAVLLALQACGDGQRNDRKSGKAHARAAAIAATDAALPLRTDTLRPVVITDTLPGDSDDPAIWVNALAPAASLVLGTDKGDSTGGLYAFDLAGHVDRTRSVTPLRRMNNVDIEYGIMLGTQRSDVAVATERNRQAPRVFRLPEMQSIDGGGLVMFGGDVARAPMGIALYRRPRDSQLFAFVSGKSGPREGYLAQYRLTFGDGRVSASLVREFGTWSGRKEIESITVDDALGYVYYSDEGAGVRKYHADPDSGSVELALLATTGVREDHEGLAIFARDSTTGYLILSDQGAGRIQVIPREGMPGAPHAHPVLAVIPVMARHTDGLDVTSRAMGPDFPTGMLAMMSERGAFHFYRWNDVQTRIDAVRPMRR